MIAVDRSAARLIVSQGPGAAYRAATIVCLSLLGFAGVLLATGLFAIGGALAAGFGVASLVLAAGWRTTAHTFDRTAATVTVVRDGPLAAARSRIVPFTSVSSVVDRRSLDGRALELVLSDETVLAVARERSPTGALDELAREIGELLEKPVDIGRGALVAGRFEVEQQIARGGMGVIYRARDQQTGVRVAVKLLLAPTDDKPGVDRFSREMKILAALDHPRIARHVAHGVAADGQAYLAMEWIDGEDLGAILAAGRLSLADSLAVVTGAAEALAHVHERDVIHRDLKPGNLILRGSKASDVVLLDFGLARRVDSATRLTGTAALVGTALYMSPEQASSSHDLTPAVDVFALGCIFYECLTGRTPFVAPNLRSVLVRILFDTPEPVRALRPAVPEAWTELLGRMLSKDAARRPPTAAALLRELQALPPAGGGPDAVEATADTHVMTPPADSGDQVLVCVVLAAPPAKAPASLRADMTGFGCPIEILADGSVLATVFPLPSATDQVRVAARAAIHLRELLPEAKIAVATGRAPLTGSPRVGDAVDRAARLLELQTSGIRLDGVSGKLLDPQFVTAAQGESFLLLGDNPDLDESRRLLGKPTPCVGRDVELAQLEALLAGAVEDRAPRAAVVLGPPGIGKSRLRHELVRRARDRFPSAEVLIGHGDPLKAGSPYALLGDALRRHAGIRVGDELGEAREHVIEWLCRHVEPAQRRRVGEFLAELCGAPMPGEASAPLAAARSDERVMSEQIAMAFLDWTAAECAVHPVLLILEDVQWGDALTVKLIESTLRELPRVPLFVLALARPEVEEAFPKLLAGQRAVSLSLQPLGDKAAETLVKLVLGDGIAREPLARIVAHAAGNALFLEELIRASVEKTGDVPETVLAILQARLSRLAPGARQVLRAGSLFGEIFWQGAVAKVGESWGGIAEAPRVLAQLVEAEILERPRKSRIPGETEYAFRHALVRDAAYGLLTDADRRAGHLAAGRWLEAMKEGDAIVLARHAEEGGDTARAISWSTRAAEQSLEQNDFPAASARATHAIDLGAAGEERGILRSIQTAASFGTGNWPSAAKSGLEALELLPKGGFWWCATVERLMQVLPNNDQVARHAELAEELLHTTPTDDARGVYLRALSVQLLGHALTGARRKARASLDVIEGLAVKLPEHDVSTRGAVALWRSIFSHIIGDDITGSLALADMAVADLVDSQVHYRLAVAHVAQSFARWSLGDFERGEPAARKGRVIAEQIHDAYHTSIAAWYLGLLLADQSDPAKLAEAEVCAVDNTKVDNPLHKEALPGVIRARAAATAGDWTRAEAQGRLARDGMRLMPGYCFLAAAPLIEALVRLGRVADAVAIAREDLALLESVGSPIFSEIVLEVAAAEAFAAAGERDAAHATLRVALAQIDHRARKISDPDLRRSFLLRRAENARAFALGREWLSLDLTA